MKAPKTYHLKISDLEGIFRMSAIPLEFEGECVYIICNSQRPNSQTKKIAVKFTDKEGDGFDVYDYDKVVEYENIQGQYPDTIGPALIRNMETIYPDVSEMVLFTKKIIVMSKKKAAIFDYIFKYFCQLLYHCQSISTL